MPSASLPTLQVDKIIIGPSPVDNPSLLVLSVDGVNYGQSYDIEETGYQRRIFPAYNADSGIIELVSIGIAHGVDMPTTTLNNVSVQVI